MATSAQGHTEFSARIARIETRGGGVADVFHGNETSGKVGRKRPRHRPAKVGMIKIPLAFAFGAASFLVARYTTFRLGELPEEFSNPDYVLGGELALALAVFFIFRLIFELTGKMHLLMGLSGVTASLMLMHNLVHFTPDLWSMVFSADWVAEIRGATEPNTAVFRDIVIPLG